MCLQNKILHNCSNLICLCCRVVDASCAVTRIDAIIESISLFTTKQEIKKIRSPLCVVLYIGGDRYLSIF